MCLALFALDAHPRFVLVIAANRDEYHARAAAPAAWWHEGWLAGRDLVAGGAWLAVDRAARWALVTNVRDGSPNNPDAPSRGALVPAVLADHAPPSASVARIVGATTAHNGFNLVAGHDAVARWGSNRAGKTLPLDAGIYGLSNAALDTPWPKVARTKAALGLWCARADADFEPLFGMLADTGRAPDDELPTTGVPLERERLLSAPFIIGDDYGTRCATVLAVGRDRGVRFVERTFDRRGAVVGEVDHGFTAERSEVPASAAGRSR